MQLFYDRVLFIIIIVTIIITGTLERAECVNKI